MKKTWKILRRVLAVLVLSGLALGIWKHDEIVRLMAVNSLFDADRIVANFSHMDSMFLTRVLSRGDGPVSPLPVAATPWPLPPETQAWIDARHVTALVVLHDGQLVHESYHRGTGGEDLRISWSVAKSFLSALFGILLDEGTIDSLDDPVTRYVPALVGSAYDGATLRNVLNMASGVKFNEDYLDFYSDINRMGRVLALGRSMDGFAAGLSEQSGTPGMSWQYVSIDTHVIGMVIRGATGRTVPDLLEERILKPMGLEAAPYYVTDGYGVAFVLGGLNLRSRDYARFGQMFLQDGMWNGRQIVPANWVRASTAPSAPTAPGAMQYGLQWWMPADATEGEFLARGIYGQYIYVNRPLGVVIVSNAADKLFREPGVADQDIAMFRAIAAGF